jgi:hypothetical protein
MKKIIQFVKKAGKGGDKGDCQKNYIRQPKIPKSKYFTT